MIHKPQKLLTNNYYIIISLLLTSNSGTPLPYEEVKLCIEFHESVSKGKHLELLNLTISITEFGLVGRLINLCVMKGRFVDNCLET